MTWLLILLVLLLLYVLAVWAIQPRRPRRLDFSTVTSENLQFPAAFQFGAATAAHQVEGGTFNNQWTAWEKTTRPDGQSGIFTGDTCGIASDHWARFEEDLNRMKAMGLTMYRFSLEWSRIEPQEGQFDAAALARYRSWCEQLHAAGITPMVTLHHFTDPLWLTEKGGFENPEAVPTFLRFVAHVVPQLADVVDHWVTINEPAVYSVMGWHVGEFPPGKHDPPMMAKVLENLMLAHAGAYRLIHELDTTDADGDGVAAQVGLAKNVVGFTPQRRWHLGDLLIVRTLHRAYNETVLNAITTGHFRLWLPGQVNVNNPMPACQGTSDFFGLNHYFRQLVAVDFRAEGFVKNEFDQVSPKNDMGWDLTPQSFYEALHFAAQYGQPIYVTENGTCDGEIPDTRRSWYLPQSLYALQTALADGVDVRGYCYWSLLDNFEWAHGFSPRFGLFRVDYPTQTRTLTEGGKIYQQVIQQSLEV